MPRRPNLYKSTSPDIADFNNDGAPDIGIASAARMTLPSKIVVALSGGAGGFVVAGRHGALNRAVMDFRAQIRYAA
jgi:hypothetical protein